jgi:putative ABC transport system substrate-binding protein
MIRRDFIAGLGCAAAWPLAARAQQPAMPVVGYLSSSSPEANPHMLAGFRKNLSEVGFVEGRNVAIEYRWARNEYDRLPELAADLVRHEVAVIAAPNGTPPALAAKAATTTIPIVFATGGDPVQIGLVASLNRPGGNITGFNSLNAELTAKRLGLLHDLVPSATRFAALVNPDNSFIAETMIKEVEAAAPSIGGQIEIVAARTSRDLDSAFASLVKKRADALLVAQDQLFTQRRVQITMLATRHVLPVLYAQREIVEAGGLMSYGIDLTDQYRQVGIYVGRILKGETPADLPVLRATKFEFVINLQAARTLGINVPPGLLAIADEVIE